MSFTVPKDLTLVCDTTAPTISHSIVTKGYQSFGISWSDPSSSLQENEWGWSKAAKQERKVTCSCRRTSQHDKHTVHRQKEARVKSSMRKGCVRLNVKGDLSCSSLFLSLMYCYSSLRLNMATLSNNEVNVCVKLQTAPNTLFNWCPVSCLTEPWLWTLKLKLLFKPSVYKEQPIIRKLAKKGRKQHVSDFAPMKHVITENYPNWELKTIYSWKSTTGSFLTCHKRYPYSLQAVCRSSTRSPNIHSRTWRCQSTLAWQAVNLQRWLSPSRHFCSCGPLKTSVAVRPPSVSLWPSRLAPERGSQHSHTAGSECQTPSCKKGTWLTCWERPGAPRRHLEPLP